MLFKPGLCLVHSRRLRSNDVPEPGRVVGLDEMGKFVDDDLVDSEHRRFDQPPVDVDIVTQGAGAPAKAIVDDLDLGNIDAESSGVKLYSRDYLLLSLIDMPFSQSLSSLLFMANRNKEPLAELNPGRTRFDHLDTVLSAKVKRGFAVYQFFPRRMRQCLILLRVLDLIVYPPPL